MFMSRHRIIGAYWTIWCKKIRLGIQTTIMKADFTTI
jgi:hypothetical protein